MKLSRFILDVGFLNDFKKIRNRYKIEKVVYNSARKIFKDPLAKLIVGSFKENFVKLEIEKIDSKPLIDKFGQFRFLYIPDHSYSFDRYDSEKNNKVHVTYCRKIKELDRKGRADRYAFEVDTSGVFTIEYHRNKLKTKNLRLCWQRKQILPI